jgi:hypothetical protein
VSRAVSRRGAARWFLVACYGLGAVSHMWFFTQHPDLYRSVADQAVIPGYRELWAWLVVPTLRWSPLLVIAFEAGMAVLMARRATVRSASLVAAGFQVALAPRGAWGVINLALAALHVYVAGVYRDDVRPVAREASAAVP